jgi:alkylhydroperoxidase/carboxymuconolactone decarboxylase family protein YurZ
MPDVPKPPKAYEEFIKRYPAIGRAWDDLSVAGRDGPLDANSQRLVKLALAIGAMREGAVHANVRKAMAAGVSREAIEQVIAMAASTIGLPATVAVFTWARDAMADPKPKVK